MIMLSVLIFQQDFFEATHVDKKSLGKNHYLGNKDA